jgi:hypothetical protein
MEHGVDSIFHSYKFPHILFHGLWIANYIILERGQSPGLA